MRELREAALASPHSFCFFGRVHPRTPGWRFLACVLGLAAGLVNAGFGATQVVDSIAALKAKLNEAVAGDTITVKNGVYTTTGSLTVACRGAADQPITIAAESIGGVEIVGTNGFNVVEPASHVVIAGFTFTHPAGKNTVGEGTTHVRFTRNTFRCTGDGAYLSVAGDDAQVDYNDFGDKLTPGSLVAIGGSGSQVARRAWVHHNYFHDSGRGAGTGTEMIRFGLSASSTSTGAGIVEHNLFARCRGQNDLVSNRSSGNTYRYNTLVDSPSSQFTLRHGNECTVYGNIFRNTGGLRIYGDRHQVFSNYFGKNYIGVNLGNGDAEVTDGAPASNHDRPDNCVVAFNTFAGNRTHYQMSRRSPGGLGARNTTFANNLLQGAVVAVKIEGPNEGATWSGNLAWDNADLGDLPAEGFTRADPALVAGPDGIERLQPGSPAIEAAEGTFPLVVVDLDGQPRPARKTIGADEASAAPVVAGMVTVNDVGPGARPRDDSPPLP